MKLFEYLRKTQVWRSIFRHGYPDTPRNRTLAVLSNVFLHLHPVKVKRHADGTLVNEFEIEIENGKPGEIHAISIDGVPLGMLILDMDGEAELELGGDEGDEFPDGFPEPKEGSIVRIGNDIQLTLKSEL